MSGPEVHGADRVDLHAALAGLGRQERTAVVLRYFDDLTVAQIADVMHLAEGSVKRYLPTPCADSRTASAPSISLPTPTSTSS